MRNIGRGAAQYGLCSRRRRRVRPDPFHRTRSPRRILLPVPAVPSTRLALRLWFRPPLRPDNLFGHLVATAVPGIEEWRAGAYRCTLRLPGGPGIAALRPESDHIACTLLLTDAADAGSAVATCRRLLDLDADPQVVDAHLAGDGVLAPLVAAAPGRRVPGTAHPDEFALRAVLGQQVSTAAARTHAARLVVAHGAPVTDPDGGLSHVFPTPSALAEIDPATLALPAARRRAFVGLVEALAGGRIDLSPTSDREAAIAALAGLPGIGP